MSNVNQEQLESIMGLIMNAGNAKSDAMEAIHAAKNGQIATAREKMEIAEKSLVKAHQSQTALLTKEASGESVEMSLLMVHGQDHLMTSIAFCDLAKEVIDIYERIN